MELTLITPDMSCAHCSATIEKALGSEKGVESVTADPGTKQVKIVFSSPMTEDEIRKVLQAAGYPAD